METASAGRPPAGRDPGRGAPCRRHAWPCLAVATCVAGLLAGSPARAEEAAAAPGTAATFQMSADPGPVRLVRCFTLIYQEAFRRLGIRLEVVTHSLARRTALLEAGAIDGEMARVRAYGDAHPELIRVEEPVYDFSFALFTADPGLRLDRLEDLGSRPLVVDYRRGVLLCETRLRELVPPERLADVLTTEQGVRKLLAGRADLYCDLDMSYVEEALEDPELRRTPGVRRVLRFASLPVYAYLAERHAALAPRLAAVLREMKAEGLIRAYAREAGLEGGTQP